MEIKGLVKKKKARFGGLFGWSEWSDSNTRPPRPEQQEFARKAEKIGTLSGRMSRQNMFCSGHSLPIVAASMDMAWANGIEPSTPAFAAAKCSKNKRIGTQRNMASLPNAPR